MRDDRGVALVALACVAALLGGASFARAQTPGKAIFRGHAELQYQKLDAEAAIADREWWVRALQLDYARRVTPTLDVSAHAQITDLSYIGRADKSRVPLASLRLANPSFGLFGSYRPTSMTDALGFTTRQQQTLLSGYWARRGWPRLDLTWDRRHQNAGSIGGGATATNRSAFASHTLGPLGVRAGYADQTQAPEAAQAHRLMQRTWNGGTTLRLGPPRASILLQYDYTDALREETAVRTVTTRSHAAAANGSLRLNPRTDVALTYSYRHSRMGDGAPTPFDDQDGALLLNHGPTKSVRLTAGGGVRTMRTEGNRNLEEYVLVSASADGRLRPGWTGGAGATRSHSWTAGGRARVVDGYRANSRMRLWHGMDLTADGLISVAGSGFATVAADSAATGGRVVSQGSVGFQAVPLRPIQITYSIRKYRAGETLMRSTVSALSDAWDIQWRPRSSLQLSGNWASSQPLGKGQPRLHTTRASAQWNPNPLSQLHVTYTRSTQSLRQAGSVELPGREVLGFRLLSGFGRDLRASVGLNVVDPGRVGSARQLDATLTRRFGG